MTSLSYQDSFSFKQLVVDGGEQMLAAKINSKIWDPQSGQVPAGFQFSVCHGLDVGKAGQQLGQCGVRCVAVLTYLCLCLQALSCTLNRLE